MCFQNRSSPVSPDQSGSFQWQHCWGGEHNFSWVAEVFPQLSRPGTANLPIYLGTREVWVHFMPEESLFLPEVTAKKWKGSFSLKKMHIYIKNDLNLNQRFKRGACERKHPSQWLPWTWTLRQVTLWWWYLSFNNHPGSLLSLSLIKTESSLPGLSLSSFFAGTSCSHSPGHFSLLHPWLSPSF